MAEKLFFGRETVSATSAGADTHYLAHFISSYSGLITSVKVHSASPGNAKLSIYDTVGTAPTNLLWSEDAGFAVIAGFNTLDISSSPLSVSSGTKYAAGYNVSALGAITFDTTTTADRTYRAIAYSGFSAPDPLPVGSYTYSAGSIYVPNFAAYGWEPPVISSIDDDHIIHGDTYTLTGTDFMTAADPITVEICNNSDYGLATVKTAQTVTSQADTSVDFTAVTTGLGGPGYIFVTTALGQMNATGYAVSVGVTTYVWIQRSDGSLSTYPHAVLII